MKEYYKDLFCACGCGGRIEIKPHHKHSGIPKYCDSGHARKNKKNSDEHNRKIALGNTGNKHSEESKKIRSENMKEIWEDPDSIFNSQITKDKISKKVTEIWKDKDSKLNSEEVRLKQSEHKVKENNPQWKGGSDSYYHGKAWELFGKDNCEICGISNEEYKLEHPGGYRLDMHNTLIPKDYTVLKKEAWMTLCSKCHAILEHQIKK